MKEGLRVIPDVVADGLAGVRGCVDQDVLDNVIPELVTGDCGLLAETSLAK